ncbi:MAG TPA: response regulator [Gemmatimonadales bacterium]|nr:response regulator [Gemmatimonadales bacterium]
MKVLLAVADGAVRGLWEGVLADHGHVALETSPSLAGWDVAAAARPDLAIVELPLSGEEALELCRRLRRPGWDPRPPLLVLIHPEQAGRMVAALRAGADDVLVGLPERRSAVAHLAALERRCRGAEAPSPAGHPVTTAYELATLGSPREPGVGVAAAATPVEPEPSSRVGGMLEALDALDRKLEAARRNAGGESLARIVEAIGTLDELYRSVGAPAPTRVPFRESEAAGPTVGEAGPATILLIDDEPGVRFPLRLALQRCGWRVIEAGDGEEGLDIVGRRDAEIALVVVDQRMPGLGGAEVVRELRRRERHLPVILMTTGVHAESASGGGPDAFLRKPFELADLARTVRRLIEPGVTAGA